MNAEPWELEKFGLSTVRRTQKIAQTNRSFKESFIRNVSEGVEQYYHNTFIHRFGVDALEIQRVQDQKIQLERLAFKKRSTDACTLLRKQIKVDQLEDGGLAAVIDREWDTRGWSYEMINAGCDALASIFYISDESSSNSKKIRAGLMLQNLVLKYPAAETYIRKNINSMVDLAATKLLKAGRSAGTFDLFYILHGCREKFKDDLTATNFCGRAIYMLLQESRLAAILIQTLIRKQFLEKQLRAERTSSTIRASKIKLKESLEVRNLKRSALGARAQELRRYWHNMHESVPPHLRDQRGGLRGPAHIRGEYTALCLDILSTLVSDRAGIRATANREDLGTNHACILLSTFLSSPECPFSAVSAEILMNMSKAVETLPRILDSGCIKSCLKFLKYLKSLHFHIDGPSPSRPISPGESPLPSRHTLLDLLSFFALLGQHASGLHRARHGYNYIKPADKSSEEIDYRDVNSRFGPAVSPHSLASHLGSPPLLREVAQTLAQARQFTVIRCVLQALLSFVGTDFFHPVLDEVLANSGVVMVRLVELLGEAESDPTLTIYSLSILLQLCAIESGRKGMIFSNVSQFLSVLTPTPLYSSMTYQSVVLVSIALCRQSDVRFYAPEQFPLSLSKSSDSLISEVYLDAMKTIKSVPPSADLTLSLLLMMDTDQDTAIRFSQSAMKVGIRPIVEFLTHPGNIQHFESLPLDRSFAGCQLIEALTFCPLSAEHLCSPGTLSYLIESLRSVKHSISKRDLSSQSLSIMLRGAISSLRALSLICLASLSRPESIESTTLLMIDSCALGFASYFTDTLSLSSPFLSQDLRDLQLSLGSGALALLDSLTTLIIHTESRRERISTTNYPQKNTFRGTGELVSMHFSELGGKLTTLLRKIKLVHGTSPRCFQFLEKLCMLFSKLTLSPPGVYLALKDWAIIPALREHLSTPLSGLGLDSLDHFNFSTSLGSMPFSLFDLCSNLARAEIGQSALLGDGFLRRALELIRLFACDYEQMKSVDLTRRVIGALRFITRMTNYHSPRIGEANQLITDPQYRVIEFSVNTIQSFELDPTLPSPDSRDDSLGSVPVNQLSASLFLSSLSFLTELSKDGKRASLLFETYDVVGMIVRLLDSVETLPSPEHVACCSVQSITSLSSSTMPRTPYLRSSLPSVRNPLTKIARIFPSLSKLVWDCNWQLSGLTGILPTSSPSPTEDPLEAFIRTNDKRFLLALDSTETQLPGHYSMCGVSCCGSLKSKSVPLLETTQDPDLALSLRTHVLHPLPTADISPFDYPDQLCEVSRLSARDRQLQTKIESRKERMGMQNRDIVPDPSLPPISLPQTPTKQKPLTRQAIPSPLSLSLDQCPELRITRPPPPRKTQTRGKMS